METFKVILILMMLLISNFPARAQGCSDVTLEDARKFYEMGRFPEVISTLRPCLASGFNDKQKIEAHRLLAFTHLAIDSIAAAYGEAARIFRLNPNYEANLFDPPAFIDMVNQMKAAGGMQMVTSVSKRAENLDEVPATVIVISRAQIRERGYQDLVELLKDVPGFDLSMFYGSQYANIYQRGFRQNNTEKTLLLIDGIEENDLWTNWAYIDRQYPLSNIDRVEIIYGPASTMYGPNAFAGVINVITRQATDAIRDGKSAGMSASGGYGSYNTRYVDMNFNAKKRSVTFSLTGRLYYTDEMDISSQEYFDYDPSFYDGVNYQSLLGVSSNATQFLLNNNLPAVHPYYTLSPDGNQLTLTTQGLEKVRSLDKSAYDMIVNGSKIGFSNKSKEGLINGKISFGNFTAGFQTWKYSSGSTTQYTDTYVPGSDNGFAWVPQLTYFYTTFENQLNEKLYFSNLTTYRMHALTQDSRFVSVSNYARGNLKLKNLVNDSPPFWTTQYAYEMSKQLRTEFKMIYSPVSRVNLISGLEIRNGTLQGSYLFSLTPTPQDSAVLNPSPKGGNSFNTWDAGIFGQADWQAMEDLKITLGLRYDYNRVRTSGGFGSVVSPRIAAVYSPGRYTFKAIYARGIMNVSNWTKYSSAGNRIPNPALKTENIENLELSGSVRLGRDFHSDINIYRSYINDVVGTVPVPGQSNYTHNDNIGKFVITGVQANLSYHYQTLTTWLNYTFCDPRQTFGETGSINNRVGDIAGHQFNIGVNKLVFDRINVNLRGNYTGKREVGQGTTVPLNNGSFPAVMVFNSAVTYSHPTILKGMELQMVCNNILNTEYFHPGTKAADGINSPTSILQRGRHFLFQVSYNF